MDFDIEQKIHTVLGHAFPEIRVMDKEERVVIAVNHEAWEALGGADETVEMTFVSGNRIFPVVRRDLGKGEVGLLWQ